MESLGAGVVVGLVALGTSGRLEDLFPEEHGVYLQVVDATQTEKIETWELSEDTWDDITVVGGQLNHLPECKHRAYECLAYDPEENLAVATWRRSRPASEIVGNHEVSDALDLMHEIRSDLEPEARFSSLLRRRLPSILRKLDRQRAMDQSRTLEGHLTPGFDDESSIDEVLAESLEEEFLPPRLQNSDDGEGEVSDDSGGVAQGLEMLAELGTAGEESDESAPRNGHAPEGEP